MNTYLLFKSEDNRQDMKVTHMDDCVEIVIVDSKTTDVMANFVIDEFEWEMLNAFIEKAKEIKNRVLNKQKGRDLDAPF